MTNGGEEEDSDLEKGDATGDLTRYINANQ